MKASFAQGLQKRETLKARSQSLTLKQATSLKDLILRNAGKSRKRKGRNLLSQHHTPRISIQTILNTKGLIRTISALRLICVLSQSTRMEFIGRILSLHHLETSLTISTHSMATTFKITFKTTDKQTQGQMIKQLAFAFRSRGMELANGETSATIGTSLRVKRQRPIKMKASR